MSNETSPIEELLRNAPQMSEAERSILLERTRSRMTQEVSSTRVPLLLTYTHYMIPLFIGLIVLLGAGGTVAASDAARPGDFLFPVDRAVEDIRLSLSSGEDREKFKLHLADERLGEFESIVDEEASDDLTGTALTSAEADIFTNETIVKIEAGDKHAIFSTDASARADIVAEIVARYGFAEADVEGALTIETEDRASRAEEGPMVSEEGRLRIEHALAVLSAFLLDDKEGFASTTPGLEEAISRIELRLHERSQELPEDVRLKVRDSDFRFESRSEDGRVRIELKDGELRVKTEDNDDDEDDDRDDGKHATSTSVGDDDDDGDDDHATSTSSGSDDDSDDDEDDNGGDDNSNDDNSGSDDDSDDEDSSGSGSGHGSDD